MPENKVLDEGGHHKDFQNGSWLELKKNFKIDDNISGFEQINILLYESQIGVIKIPDDIFAIGHKKVIRYVFPLAGIEIAEKVFPKAKEFACKNYYSSFSKWSVY